MAGRFATECVAFRFCQDVGSRHDLLSGLNHAAYTLTVYASQPRLPVHVQPRKTRFQLLARLDWVGLVTHRDTPKGFSLLSFDFLLPQAWPGARQINGLSRVPG